MATSRLRNLLNRSNLPERANEESPANAGLFCFLEIEMVKLREWFVPPIVVPLLLILLVAFAALWQSI